MTLSEKVTALTLAGMIAVLYLSSRHTPPSPALQQHDSVLAARPHVDSIIAEHADSARSRIKIVYVQQDDATRRALIAKQQDSLAQVAIQAHDFELAYHHEQARADTLAAALTVEQHATRDALATSAFWQLAYLADSTARHDDQADAANLATELRATRRRKLWDCLAVGCSYGTKGVDCGVGLRIPIGR